MATDSLRGDWDSLADKDALWTVLSDPAKRGGGWNEKDFFETGNEEIRLVMDYIKKLGLSVPSKRALDFGCGVGRLTRALAPYFNEVCGVDVSTKMIEFANRCNPYPDKCIYYLNLAPDLKLFDDGRFDFIYSNIVLQHIKPEYSKMYIKEFLRVLAPRGILIFQLPSKRFPPKTVKEMLKRVFPSFILTAHMRIKYGGAIRMYCVRKAEIERLIKDSGGSIVNAVCDESAGPGLFESYRYCVTKNQA